jgi:3-oxoacyl-[acyl-carrier protein] reductase
VGEAVASAFADLGATLLLVDRAVEKASARAGEIESRGGVATAFACDLADARMVDDLAATIRRDHGGSLKALVHLAGGFAMSGPVGESSVDVWTRQLSINLTTSYLVARAFLPLLREGRGSIVFFASEAALPGASVAGKSAYAVAKSGVVTLMRAISAEERQNGVRANAVAPTSIRTATNVASMGGDARYVEREQVASVVTFLCSAGASAVTGSVVPVA